MTEENILEGIFTNHLDDMPTFSDEMIRQMSEEIEKAKKEAEKYYKENAGN